MSDLTPTPATAPLEPPPNRLSILHLMGWTLGSALILGIWRLIEAYQPQPERQEWFRVTQQLLGSMIYGAAVGSLILVVIRRMQHGPRFPNQPGHWILVILGTRVLVNWLLRAAVIFYEGGGPFVGYFVFGLHQFIYEGIGIVLYALALVANIDSRRWKVFFAILLSLTGIHQMSAALTMISGSFWIRPGSLNSVLWPIPAVALLVVVVLDARRRVPRDYLHWAGVAAWFGNLAMYLLNQLYFAFLRSQ